MQPCFKAELPCGRSGRFAELLVQEAPRQNMASTNTRGLASRATSDLGLGPKMNTGTRRQTSLLLGVRGQGAQLPRETVPMRSLQSGLRQDQVLGYLKICLQGCSAVRRQPSCCSQERIACLAQRSLNKFVERSISKLMSASALHRAALALEVVAWAALIDQRNGNKRNLIQRVQVERQMSQARQS